MMRGNMKCMDQKLETLLRVLACCAGFFIVVSPILLFAGDTTFKSPVGDTTLYAFLVKILNAVIYILFPVLVLMIVYTGFLFVKAQGSVTAIGEARRALMYTVIGSLVVLGSKAIALAVEATVKSISSGTS